MIGSIADLTERRRHEEERLRLEAQSQESKKLEALGQFAGGVAHDFNNFLGAILGYAQFIVEDSAMDSGGDHSASRYAQRILTAGRRGRALVEQILTFTRRTRMTRRRFHLSELLGEIEELMFASAVAAVDFRCENADPDAVVEADRDQLGQVLLNLCINAQDALRGRPGSVTVRIRRTALGVETAMKLKDAGETVTVWTDADGTAFAVAGSFDAEAPHVSLIVSDTGFGMDASLLEQAFTPFFTTKEKGHGTGLGLAVVRGIVLAHGAALIARSREGDGTSIEIVLPRIEIAIPRVEPASVPAVGRAKRRILLVDDDADFCDMMHLLLERLGFEVVPYTRAKEALNDFREMPATWDALITDQNMPEMSGLELLAAVKAQRPDLPCLICSAFSESLTDAALREAGAFALVRKPVDKDLLLATLERAVGTRGARVH
jgi:signal transduction histidine kinase/ActR/RegA family two-component response regulator